MIDEAGYDGWKDDGQIIQFLHRATTWGLHTPGGGIVTNGSWERLLKHKDLGAALHRLVLRYRGGHMSMSELELELRNVFGKAGFPGVLEKMFIETFGKLKRIYRTECLGARMVIDSLNQGSNFLRAQWPLLGESAMAWGVRELWIEGMLFWISHNLTGRVGVKLPRMAVYVYPVTKVSVSGTVEEDSRRKKPWLRVTAHYGLYEPALAKQVKADEYVVNKHSGEIALMKQGEHGYEVTWDEDEVLVKKVKQSVSQLLLDEEQLEEIRKAVQLMESKLTRPISVSWQIVNKKLQITAVTWHNPEVKAKVSHRVLNPLVHGDTIVRGVAAGQIAFVDKLGTGLGHNMILYVNNWKKEYARKIAKSAGVIVGGVAYHELLEIKALLTDLGIVSLQARLEHVRRLPKVVTLDSGRGVVYEGDLVHRMGEPKMIKRMTVDSLEVESLVKQPLATQMWLAVPELTTALPDLDSISGLVVDGDSLWRKLDTHPGYLKEHKKTDLIIEPLVENLTTLCLTKAPSKVVYCLSRLTSQDWRGMKMGKAYELPNLDNNIYGAERYLIDNSQLDIELRAIKQVRHKKRMTNLWIEVPGVRSVEQLREMKKYLSAHGLTRSVSLRISFSLETMEMIESLEEVAQLGIDGVTLETDKLLGYYSGRIQWEVNPKTVALLCKAVQLTRKLKLDHRLVVNSQFGHDTLLTLLQFGLSRVQVELGDGESLAGELRQAELMLVRKR